MVTQLYRAHCVSLHWVHRRIVHAMVTQLYRAHCVSLHWVHRRIVHAMVTQLYRAHCVSLHWAVGGEFMPWLLNYTGHTVSLYTGYIGG